jgi:hypothetical protein
MTRRPILGCQFVYVRFLSDGFMSRRRCPKYWRISEEIVAILVRARSGSAGECSGGLRWNELGTGGVAAVSPVVTSAVWEK